MKKYNTISVDYDNDIVKLYLNRPEKSNAINIEMIRELNEAINFINKNNQYQFLIISSKGKSFCSGADLKWMSDAFVLSKDQNLSECMELSELYYNIFNSNKIVISVIKGACIGGGIGLAAASDFCIASKSSYFQFGEVKLGLVPATISPYVIQRIGYQKSKIVMLTGEKFDSQFALEIGLVDQLIDSQDPEKSIDAIINTLRSGGKEAIQNIKSLVNDLGILRNDTQIKKLTAEIIASARVSEEGKEGIKAFLEKRKPNW